MRNTVVPFVQDPGLRRSTDGPLVLVVDDDVTVRSLARENLRSRGYRTVEIADGTAAVDTFRRLRPDAVLLDVVMPGCDGFSICRALRELPEARFTPIVMLTSMDDVDAIQKAFDAGATDFCTKPANWYLESLRLNYMLRSARSAIRLHEAEHATRLAKQEWERTFEAIGDAVLVLDPDRTIRRANRAATRLAATDDARGIVGKSCREVFCRGRVDEEECPCNVAVEQAEPRTVEVSQYGATRRNCLSTAFPVLDDSGSVTAVVHIAKDITELRELEQELLHAQKMEAVGVLAAGIAHDFNNLLQAIQGLAESALDTGDAERHVGESLSQIVDVVHTGRSLTRQLQFTSRKVATKKRPTDVGQIMRQSTALLTRTLPEAVVVEDHIAEDLWWVDADEAHIQQVLMNLAINAAQAMPDGGRLGFDAENIVLEANEYERHPELRPGRHVLLTVSDTGCGIAREMIPRIFEPFFTTKSGGEGTGLGLSVAYGIVSDHAGWMSCDSEVGVGTTFRVYLPASDGSPPIQDDATGRLESSSIEGCGETVLVAEDEAVILLTTKRLLAAHGYRVLDAVDGEETLQTYREHGDDIDLVVLDLNMPRMDGESCLEELLTLNPGAKVILATGAILSGEREASLLSRARGIVKKPFQSDALLQKIRRVLDTD